ncbi:MAG: fimbrillin family protein [Bacteroidaceae bacterium]|nr:fimbrillin family protein [Bacteroidaceae bacterium]
MKKSFLILATAAMFAACTNDSVRENIADDQVEIGFSTYIQKPVASKADNSTASEVNSLSDYHTTFVVNGYKTIGSNNEPVFEDQLVKYVSSAWTYSPKKIWDKSASGYSFFAAAPFSANWAYADGKYKYTDFELTGSSLEPTTELIAAAVFGAEDLMIATDVTDYKTYESTPVNFSFNHILSRLNIAVKCTGFDTDYNVLLNEVKVYNMTSNGSFNEAAVLGTDELANGTIERWTSATVPAKYTEGVGYANAIGLDVNETPNYVYQALIIPQEVAYVADVALNGTGLSAESAPYLNIKYTVNGENFNYFYNLADMFNAAAETSVKFCEGWQNNLTINIGMAEINFDAQVYEWVNKETGSFDVE